MGKIYARTRTVLIELHLKSTSSGSNLIFLNGLNQNPTTNHGILGLGWLGGDKDGVWG